MLAILITGAGAAWESAALALLEQRSDIVVLRRCVDIDDLLAAASAGQAGAAVVALDAPGLDVAAVDHLRRHGVRPVAVAPAGAQEAGRARAGRIGIRTVVAAEELDRLPMALTGPESPPPPRPETRLGPEAAAELPSGRAVVVWGPAGAPGRSLVATTLAAALSRRTPTVLVDADPYGGSLAQALGILDEVSGLLAAARLAAAGELAERVSSVQRALGPSFRVVTGLPRPDRWVEVRAETVEALVESLAERGHVVVDTGFCLEEDEGRVGARPGRNQMTIEALSTADDVLAVGTADPVGLSRLARGLLDLRELDVGTPVRVVINRMRPSLGWSEREVGELVAGMLGHEPDLHFLPEDRAAADRAMVAGRTLHEAASDSPFVAAVERLADAVAPDVGGPVVRRRWRRPVRPRTAGTARPR